MTDDHRHREDDHDDDDYTWHRRSKHGGTLGEQNGWTVPLFKIALIIIPILLTALIGLNTWLVVNTFEVRSQVELVDQKVELFVSTGPRYSALDARADMSALKENIMKEVNEKFPPRWLLNTVEASAQRIKDLEDLVYKKRQLNLDSSPQ